MTLRVGLMGFGRVGRQLYQLAREDDELEMVAISDIGRPDILHHLLVQTMPDSTDVRLENNYLVCEQTRTRLMHADHPAEIPWDVFGVDVVIEATGRFGTRAALEPHLGNGAHRVVMARPPHEAVDRVVLFGVNEDTAQASDRIVSAGSASTTAMGLALKTLSARFDVAHATMTSVHAYTSDQILQDYAGADYRRSRAAAENIIPNDSPAPLWVAQALPQFEGRLSGYALNVPVQTGSMLDMTVALNEDAGEVDAINDIYRDAAAAAPALLQVTEDPIVSSDVRGCAQSLLVDLQATMRAGARMVKVLGWHESLGHAYRIMDLVKLYHGLDQALREAS